jgi:hypothetical protein
MNEAPGKAAVHCVIIGFGTEACSKPRLFEYEHIKGEAHEVAAANINPYLADAPDVLIPRRDRPLCAVPEIGIGNKPIDGGQYLFTPEERDEFIAREPGAARWFRRWIGADEFLNGYDRWCLWLGDCPPAELRTMPEAKKRVETVRAYREASKSAPTRKLAATPTRFHVENMPGGDYLAIPEVSSERRRIIPIGYLGPETFCSNLMKIVSGATLYHFGILSSTQHNAWVRYVAGRLESRYRYSAQIVYNNFPWPSAPTAKQTADVEAAAQAVLDARAAEFARDSATTLATLYDPDLMPPTLVRAHQALDRTADAAYAADAKALGLKSKWNSDRERVAFLFALYQRLTSLPGTD